MATTRSPAAKTCAGICEQLSNLLRYEQQNKKQEGAKGASAEPRVKKCAGVPQPSAHQRWQLGAGGPECVFWSESRGAGRTSSSRVTDPACFNKIARSGQAEDPGTTRTTRSALTLPKLTQWAGCCSACTRRNRLREMCVVQAPAGCRGPGRLNAVHHGSTATPPALCAQRAQQDRSRQGLPGTSHMGHGLCPPQASSTAPPHTASFPYATRDAARSASASPPANR